MTAMFVNLPVTDLERAKAFYTAIGFTINPAFTDHNAACIVVEEDHSALMLLMRDYFQTFTERPIADPTTTVVTVTAIFGPDITSMTVGGTTSTVPSGVAVALFATIATWVVARYGLRRKDDES